MSPTPDPQTNPHTGRSRSSTLSGAFGPITPNPSRGMQHHERRPSFLGSLLGLKLSGQAEAPFAASGFTGDKWSPASSVAETDEGAPPPSTAPTTMDSTADIKTGDMSSPLQYSPHALSASLSALGTWKRAANWMADKSKDEGMLDTNTSAVPTSPISGSGQYVGETTLGRRMSIGSPFRRPFEMPTFTSLNTSADEGFMPLSRVVSAPSITECNFPSSPTTLSPTQAQGEDRGRAWWGSPKPKPKRKLSPMGERMIRDSMFH